MTPAQQSLLFDAAQFAAGAVADGYGDEHTTRLLAHRLAAEAGKGEQMGRVLQRIQPRKCPGFILSQVCGLVREFTETGRNRDRAGDEPAALAFYSAGERLGEVLRADGPAPAECTDTRKYFIAVCDADTNEPIVAKEIDARDFDHAAQIARALGLKETNGRPIRISSLTEQIEPANSFFVRASQSLAASLVGEAAPASFRP